MPRKPRIGLRLFPALILLAVLSVVVGAAIFLPRPGLKTIDPNEFWPRDTAIKVDVFTDQGKHLGDEIAYTIRVAYDPKTVDINSAKRALESINFEPFLIKNHRTTERRTSSGITVYTSEYILQLLKGPVNKTYQFPGAILEHKNQKTGLNGRTVFDPAPIFVSSRLPENLSSLELKTLKGEIGIVGTFWAVWVLVALGCVLAAAAVILASVKLFRRIVSRGRSRPEYLGDFVASCESLRSRLESCDDPKDVCRAIYRITRALLSDQSSLDWLEPDFDKIDPKAKEEAINLLERCAIGYGSASVERERAQELIEALEKIIVFYIEQNARHVGRTARHRRETRGEV